MLPRIVPPFCTSSVPVISLLVQTTSGVSRVTRVDAFTMTTGTVAVTESEAVTLAVLIPLAVSALVSGSYSITAPSCRMFPLGRLYEDGTFSYFLQVNECPKENKTKVKVRRWLDTPELGKYEAFTTKWHYYLKEKQNAARESEDDAFRQQISMNILKLFYLLPYDGNTDFYTQFAARMELAADKH